MFNEILGNTKNKQILNNIIENENISHSYIFTGPDGIGKKLFAKEFAKAILCNNAGKKPCDICKSCIEYENLNHPDFRIVDEGKDSIKTEQIKYLVKDVLEKPLNKNKKVYIINNSENMTREAQNALLKTLEEPPEYIVIILITSNENLLLNTIKSRCIKIFFSKLTDDEMKQYFNNDITESMLKYSNGSICKALAVKSKENLYLEISKNVERIRNVNELEFLKLKNKMFVNKDNTEEVLEYINTIIFNIMLNNLECSVRYKKCIEIIENTKNRLNRNANYDMTIDNCLLSLWEEMNG